MLTGILLLVVVMMLSDDSFVVRIRQNRKLKQTLESEKGQGYMSRLLEDLKGETCDIRFGGETLFSYSTTQRCTVVDVDVDWVRITYSDKADQLIDTLVRVETIIDITRIA